MPRRKKKDFTREIGVDPIYGSELIQKFINIVMLCGKKSVARKIVYDSLDVLAKKANGDKDKALAYFNEAFKQLIPAVEVRSRRVGGSVYQIPREVDPKRARSLAMRWLLTASAARPDRTMGERLAKELMEAHEGRGNAIKKKLDVHRMAEANRAFSHYAW